MKIKSTNPIPGLFGKSPFKAMQNHMRIVNDCIAEVPGLFQALVDGDAAALEEQKDKIFEKEEEADHLKNSLRSHLPKSIFMPVDRRDLLELLDMQDSIADTADCRYRAGYSGHVTGAQHGDPRGHG